METKGLDYYNSLEYTVILKKLKDRFLLYIPEICSIAEDENLNQAYVKLAQDKESYFKKLIENGYEDLIKLPEISQPKQNKTKSGYGFWVDLISFFIKFSAVGFVILLSIQTILPKLVIPDFRNIDKILINKGIHYILKTEEILRTIPPEKKEKLYVKYRSLIHEMRPFVDELKNLLKDNPQGENTDQPVSLPEK
ncbi:MAG: hypothetical protein HQK77_17395 [Desulfobacterales bacterium]|nr:hypothetical protein [Desulfobacterales bacterium]